MEEAWSKLLADYKPKYFSRLIKTTKNTYFRKITSHCFKFYKYGLTECRKIPSELIENLEVKYNYY